MVGAQLLLTFGAANVAGAVAATNYQNQQVRSAQVAISAAKASFDHQVKRSLDDGTPLATLDPLVKHERDRVAKPLPTAASIVDLKLLAAMRQLSTDIRDLSAQVTAAQTHTEVQLHHRLFEAIRALRDDAQPATEAGLDVAEFKSFADAIERDHQQLATPKATETVIDAVKAKNAELKDRTAQRIAANQALAAAQDDARRAVAAAQAALTKAQAIPVLKVADKAAAIALLADRLSHAAGLEQFQDIAAKAWAQSSALNTLLSSRQSAYDLLSTTRIEIGMAQSAGKDVVQDSANLDAAAKQLDAASDLPNVQAAEAAIQAVKNSVDAKYWQAIYGQGKVIVISLQRQELIALENGQVKLDTLVTTGRPALPTPPGVYHVFYKSSPYHMHSPWPPGDPYWYPDVDMKYAMEFIQGGYFLHDAPWRSQYGPGTSGTNGTHGCVNIPRNSGQMDFLYSWTDMGRMVVVLQGDFGSHP